MRQVDARHPATRRARGRPRRSPIRSRAAAAPGRPPAGRSGAARCPRARAAPRAGRSGRSSPIPWRGRISRSSRPSSGGKPSPRFASVVGHRHTAAPASATRSSSPALACVAWTTVVPGARQPVRGRSSIGRTPCSARHSSISRGCSSAWTWSDETLALGVAADLGQPGGRARADGVGGEADPGARRPQRLDLAEVLGRPNRWRKRSSPPRSYAASRRTISMPAARGRLHGRARLVEAEVVELARPRCSRRRAALCTSARTRSRTRLGRLPAGLGEHRVAPGPEVAAGPAPAQGALEGMECAVTNPGSGSRSTAMGRDCHAHEHYARESMRRWPCRRSTGRSPTR